MSILLPQMSRDSAPRKTTQTTLPDNDICIYMQKSWHGPDQLSPSLSRAGLGARGVCFEIHYARYIELLICMWPTQCNCKPPFELSQAANAKFPIRRFAYW